MTSGSSPGSGAAATNTSNTSMQQYLAFLQLQQSSQASHQQQPPQPEQDQRGQGQAQAVQQHQQMQFGGVPGSQMSLPQSQVQHGNAPQNFQPQLMQAQAASAQQGSMSMGQPGLGGQPAMGGFSQLQQAPQLQATGIGGDAPGAAHQAAFMNQGGSEQQRQMQLRQLQLQAAIQNKAIAGGMTANPAMMGMQGSSPMYTQQGVSGPGVGLHAAHQFPSQQQQQQQQQQQNLQMQHQQQLLQQYYAQQQQQQMRQKHGQQQLGPASSGEMNQFRASHSPSPWPAQQGIHQGSPGGNAVQHAIMPQGGMAVPGRAHSATPVKQDATMQDSRRSTPLSGPVQTAFPGGVQEGTPSARATPNNGTPGPPDIGRQGTPGGKGSNTTRQAAEINDTDTLGSMGAPLNKASKASGASSGGAVAQAAKDRESRPSRAPPKPKPFGTLSEADQALEASDPFYAELFQALRERDVQYRVPSMCQIPIDYKQMWELVQKQGGNSMMTTPKHWREVGTGMGYPTSNSNIPSFLRKNYQGTLLILEEWRLARDLPVGTEEAVAPTPGAILAKATPGSADRLAEKKLGLISASAAPSPDVGMIARPSMATPTLALPSGTVVEQRPEGIGSNILQSALSNVQSTPTPTSPAFPPDVYEYKKYLPKMYPRDSNWAGGVEQPFVEKYLRMLNGGLEQSIVERWRQGLRNHDALRRLESDIGILDVATLQSQLASRISHQVASALNILLVMSVNESLVLPLKDCMGLVRTLCDLVIHDVDALERHLGLVPHPRMDGDEDDASDNESLDVDPEDENVCTRRITTLFEREPHVPAAESDDVNLFERIHTSLLILRNWTFVVDSIVVLSSLGRLQKVISRAVGVFLAILRFVDPTFPFLSMVPDASQENPLVWPKLQKRFRRYCVVDGSLSALQHCMIILSNLSLTFELQHGQVRGKDFLMRVFDLVLFSLMWNCHWKDRCAKLFPDPFIVEDEMDYQGVSVLTNLLVSSDLMPLWDDIFLRPEPECRLNLILMLTQVIDFVGIDRSNQATPELRPPNKPHVHVDMGMILLKHLLHSDKFVTGVGTYWYQSWQSCYDGGLMSLEYYLEKDAEKVIHRLAPWMKPIVPDVPFEDSPIIGLQAVEPVQLEGDHAEVVVKMETDPLPEKANDACLSTNNGKASRRASPSLGSQDNVASPPLLQDGEAMDQTADAGPTGSEQEEGERRPIQDGAPSASVVFEQPSAPIRIPQVIWPDMKSTSIPSPVLCVVEHLIRLIPGAAPGISRKSADMLHDIFPILITCQERRMGLFRSGAAAKNGKGPAKPARSRFPPPCYGKCMAWSPLHKLCGCPMTDQLEKQCVLLPSGDIIGPPRPRAELLDMSRIHSQVQELMQKAGMDAVVKEYCTRICAMLEDNEADTSRRNYT